MIVVQAIAGSTVDLDEPDVEISIHIIYQCSPGKTIISPITTLVHEMNEGLTFTDARMILLKIYQLIVHLDIMGDYVAKTSNNHYAEMSQHSFGSRKVLSIN